MFEEVTELTVLLENKSFCFFYYKFSLLIGMFLCPQCQNYNAAVLENQPPGTFVLSVQAYDADMGVNGEVKYGIMHRDGVSSGFEINPDTGELYINVQSLCVLCQNQCKLYTK